VARGRLVRTAAGGARRPRTAPIAAAAALVLLAAAGCGTTVPMGAATQTPTASASVPAATLAEERNAVTQLQDYLLNPHGGTLAYNTIQVTSGGTVNVMTMLAGPFDPTGTASLSGSIETLGSGATTTGDASALEYAQQVYTTIPVELQTGDRADKQWDTTALAATWEGNAVHSGWWQVLYQTRDLKLVGVTGLDNTSVNVFTEVLDLSKLADVPSALLDSEALRKAGTTKVEIDVDTLTGSGKLAKVTYKIGLPVAIDISATDTSTAGYQVDLSGLENVTPTPSASPTASAGAPPPDKVANGAGDVDLAALLLF
jgi:hypothetical protein